MKIDGKLIESAYIYLKNHIYYENLNLFMRERISSFEKEHKLLDENVGGNIFEEIAKVISDNNNTDKLDEWIDSISFRIIPKSFEDSSHKNTPNSNEEGRFISNDKSTGIHNPEKLNYFIDANVEVYIIDMLWSLYVGPILDGMLTEDCYGNRLRNHAKEFIKEYSECNNTGDVSGHNNLFIRYIDQYNKWRNNAINKARLLSDDNNSVGVISLDLKEFFYNIDIDLDKVDKIIKKECSKDIKENALKLNNLLKRIFKKYYVVVNKELSVTHNKCKDKKILPIGFTSSSILSNWYMIDFDKKIQEKLKPIYYGRYVDDILIVLSNPIFDEACPLESLYKKYFLSTYILVKDKSDKSCYIIRGKDISIQKKKVVFQFFDKANSKAGLELFKQELDERSSAFKFLPTEQFYREMDEFAYEILFSGPSDKLRNVIGVVENETKLSQYLSSCITANRLCKTRKRDKDIVISQLLLFFKGHNSLKFSRLWEKVYQYSFIVNDINFAIKFYNHLVKEISIISYPGSDNAFLTEKIREDLYFYNQISFSLSLALIKYPIHKESLEVKKFFYKFPELNNLMELANGFRYSNLIRHHLVAWPLSNYTVYEGNLIDENKILEDISSKKQSHHEINSQKKKYSPRFLHIDELQIFELSQKLRRNSLSEWQAEFAKMRSGFVKWENEEEINNNIDKFSLSINDASRRNNYFKLAIANLIVNQNDIVHALRDDEKPNLSFDRQKIIYQILNDAVKEKVDLLVLPEVSIPVSWLPFMASFSRRNQIGLIFGLEHWVIDKVAFNILIELLPFSQKEGFKNCYITARVKNHYAPAELECMRSFGLVAGNETNNRYSYHKVNWRGACFATYNCFELADITHRVLFKSEINLLIACVWNKDTNYYQHILESAVRDLHCYTIQVNTSQYGGSCVLQPTKTEQKTLLYVKGGSNPCILTTNLDIQKLSKFHYQHAPLDGDTFKPLPPGFHEP